MIQVVCPSFHAELVPVISNRVMNTPLSAALFDQYFINYALLGNCKVDRESSTIVDSGGVDFREDAVYLRHRGNSFGILRQGMRFLCFRKDVFCHHWKNCIEKSNYDLRSDF